MNPSDLVAELLATMAEQARVHGHTPESDEELPVLHLAELVRSHAQYARDVCIPGDHENLPVGYKRAMRVAALALALARRIKTEQARR